MLDPKNNSLGNTSGIGSEANKENISPHTMQDDLDVLDGKIIENKEIVSDNVQGATTKGKSESETRNATSSPFTGSLPHQMQSDISPKTEAHVPETKKHQNFKIDRENEKEKEKMLPKASVTKSLKWNKILILVLAVIIILIFAAGGYYFWTTRSSVDPVAQLQPPKLSEEPIINVPSERFSTENPNYLNVEVENVTADDIKQLLGKVALEVKESKIKVPVEFLIADDNNNPIAFPRFAYLFQLNLSSETLSSLEENFSLYLYNDNENIKLGITVDFRDKEKITAEMTNEEKSLVKNLSNLFLGADVEKENISFNDGKYKNYSIRYVNLDEQETISLDYALTDSHLVIGTSKSTVRAILDKVENNEIIENTDNTDTEISE